MSQQTQLQQLNQGLDELNIALAAPAQQALIDYLALLSKWNHVYNLTAIRDPDKMVSQHLLDSLSVYPFISGQTILDVGSGAGLPGIPLAIAYPNKQFVLLDSLQKRTQFLQQVCFELKLENATVVNSRVEDYHPDSLFDQIITRAFASLANMLTTTNHLIMDTGQFLAMKGDNYEKELDEIPEGYTMVAIHPLHVPGLLASRHVLILERSHCG